MPIYSATGGGGGGSGSSLDALSGWGMAPNFVPHTATSLRAYDSANRAYYSRMYGTLDITKVAIRIGTSSGNISIAAYTNSGAGRSGLPTGGRKQTTGAISCPASGATEVSLGATASMSDGDWYGFSCDNTTATFDGFGPGITVSPIWTGYGGYEETAHPVPATPTFAQAGLAYHVHIIGVA